MQMTKGLFGTNYGVYATSRRIIGVGGRGMAMALGGVLGGAVGAVAGSMIAGQKNIDQAKVLEELERKKDFEIAAADISTIELKKFKPFRSGHLLIIPKSGDRIEIKLSRGKIHDELKELMQAFCQRNPSVQLTEAY